MAHLFLATGHDVGHAAPRLLTTHNDRHVVVCCRNNPEFILVVDRETDAVIGGNLPLDGYRAHRGATSLLVRHEARPGLTVLLLDPMTGGRTLPDDASMRATLRREHEAVRGVWHAILGHATVA